jgi:hypothetical protein
LDTPNNISFFNFASRKFWNKKLTSNYHHEKCLNEALDFPTVFESNKQQLKNGIEGCQLFEVIGNI